MTDPPAHREVDVFNAVRRLAPDQRASFLESSCAGDDVLQRRVEELLRAGDDAGTFLETPPVHGAGLSQTAAVMASAEKPGDRIGHYKLLQQIGEGGCGVVYMAEQAEPVQRRVALKVIKLGMDTREVIARFEAERQALAMMDHPNIARVFDAGATETGRPYFVMELVRGVKITDYCDENQLSTGERLALFIQVCQAIQHAHQKGIIHRDIKPSNILVTTNDGLAVPKVIDFGIAKATQGRLTNKTLFTAFEQFIGTPAYMSPEQAAMTSVDIDTRSDIYSLGVLLYELLTGTTPFDATSLLQSGLDEIRRVIRDEDPDQPSTKLSTMQVGLLTTAAKRRSSDAYKLVQSIKGDLDWIVMRALEKDRARRYETASGLAADVRRHLNNEPVLARPQNSIYRFQKLVHRHKLVFAATGIIVAALAVATVLSVRAERKAREEAAMSKQVAKFLEDMLKGIGPSVALGRDTSLLKDIMDKTGKRVDTELVDQPAVAAELHYTIGQVYWELGDLDDAEAMHRWALNQRIKLFGEENADVALSRQRLGHVLWRQGHLVEAQKMTLQAIGIHRRLFGNHSIEVARALEDLSAILSTMDQVTEAEKVLRRAVEIKEEVLGDDNLEVAYSMQDLASFILSWHHKSEEALALARKSLAIRQKILGADNPVVVVDTLRNEATELDVRGKTGDQEAVLRKLIEAQRKLFGGPHPDLARSLNTLASVLNHEGKTAESESLRREALSMQGKLLGPASAEVAQTMFNLGQLLADEGKLAEAEEMQRNSLTIRRKVLDARNLQIGSSLSELGLVLEKEAKFDDARELYLEAAKGTGPGANAAQCSLGSLYLNGKGVECDAKEAAKWFRQSAAQGYSRAQLALGRLYFNGVGVPKDEGIAVLWFNRAAAHNNNQALPTLADCYLAEGRYTAAVSVLGTYCANHASASGQLTLAVWQAWFGREADYEASRLRMLRKAEKSEDAALLESAAKAACLRPCADAATATNALEVARRAAAQRKNSPWLPWYQLSLGMAEYRNGQYAEAERVLDGAAQASTRFPDIPGTARFYRAMCLFQLGRVDEARKLFDEAEAQMPPFPEVETKPVLDGTTASHDALICWLIYKEARGMVKKK